VSAAIDGLQRRHHSQVVLLWCVVAQILTRFRPNQTIFIFSCLGEFLKHRFHVVG
jgi:hypothetical protein